MYCWASLQGKEKRGCGWEQSVQNKACSFRCSAPTSKQRRAAAWGRPALTVHGHLVYLGGVVLLNVSQDADVVILHKVDCYTFSAVTA